MSNGNEVPILKMKLRDLGQYLIDLSEKSDAEPIENLSESLSSMRGRLEADDTPKLKALALNEYRSRRARAKHFNANLFSEAGWDILLDLFLAKADGLQISITSACLATSCPATTALRWINILEEQGFVSRVADIKDQRRTWLAISADGLDRMRAYLRGKEATERQRDQDSMASRTFGVHAIVV